MAVGLHKAACQRLFGARCTPDSGLTFGDNIQHLWASVRKHGHLLKYMSSANRQDFVTMIVNV